VAVIYLCCERQKTCNFVFDFTVSVSWFLSPKNLGYSLYMAYQSQKFYGNSSTIFWVILNGRRKNGREL